MISFMERDWQDERISRLERDLHALQADVRRRFWERDERALRFLGWVVVGLSYVALGIVLGRAAAGG